jgi:ABC-type polar amino acid transport system ATPase subunit
LDFQPPYTNQPIFYSTAARITVGLTDLRSLRLKVGMVFPQFDLYPHLAAGQNVMLSPAGFFG